VTLLRPLDFRSPVPIPLWCLDVGAHCWWTLNMLLWLKKNHSRLLAGFLMGCSLMFLSGCFTTRMLENSQPHRINTGYKVDAVESAAKLPSGDIVLSINGRERLTDTEPLKAASFALLISAKEIQAANERDEERRKTGKNSYEFGIPAIRCDMQAAKGGAPFLVLQMQNINTEDAKPIMGVNAAAVLVTNDRIFAQPHIEYIEQRDNGNVFRVAVKPEDYLIEKPRRNIKWLWPFAILGDVVTSPFQAVYMVILVASGWNG